MWVTDSRADFSGGGIFTEAGSSLVVANGSSLNDNRASHGGGIAANGNVSLIDAALVGNVAELDEGGGLQVYSGQTTLLHTLVWLNEAAHGGGLLLPGGTTSISDSNIQSNTASGRGGGIAIYDDAQVDLRDDT